MVVPKQSTLISDISDTVVEQIFRELDIKTLFVVGSVNGMFHRCALQVLKEVTHLGLIREAPYPNDGKPNFDLLPVNAVVLNTLCRFPQHRFPKKISLWDSKTVTRMREL